MLLRIQNNGRKNIRNHNGPAGRIKLDIKETFQLSWAYHEVKYANYISYEDFLKVYLIQNHTTKKLL